MKERLPFAEEPEKLELDEIECCALAHAFAKNKDAVSQLLDLGNKDLLKKSADILVRSKSLAFLHNPEVDLFYQQIAKTELGRLMGGKGELRCAHSEKDHRASLESVIEKTAGQPLTKVN